MNKLIGTLLAGLMVLAQHGVQAQVSDHASVMNVHALGVESAVAKASRDFWQRVGDQKDEHWYKAPSGYEAEYADGPVKALYRYDKKGHWVYSILTYGEDRLPADVRELVRSNYYDFAIGWVKEVSEAQNLVYVVHIENNKAWKDVAVQDGEMRVLNEFCK
jgi:hypothetical protein